MALVDCPECGNEISDRAVMCPKCGFGTGVPAVPYLGYEYRSEASLFGLPLVHIASGYDPSTGRPRVAKGIIAVGNIAVGGLAFGGMAVGLVAIGGGAVGYYALGGGAWGPHPLGGNAQDPQAIEFFKRFLGPSIERFRQ